MANERGFISRLMKFLHDPVYASRLRELVRCIVPHLRAGDRVLDVGCGTGALGRSLMSSLQCPEGVQVTGLERFKRGGEPIPVQEYDGKTIPYGPRAFDVVILADVLHHESDPHSLIAECVRVSNRLIIIKDHKLEGLLAQQRLALLDWAANAPHGVPCLYRYNTAAEWREWEHRHGLQLRYEARSMNLYPLPYEFFLGGKLQYMAVLDVPERKAEEAV